MSASGSSFLDSHRLTPSMLRLQANFSVEYIHVLKLSPILLTYSRQNSLKCIDGSPVSSRIFLNSHLLTPYSTYIYKTQLQCDLYTHYTATSLQCTSGGVDSVGNPVYAAALLPVPTLLKGAAALWELLKSSHLCRFMFCVWAFQNLASLCSGDPPMCSGKVFFWHFSPTNLVRW